MTLFQTLDRSLAAALVAALVGAAAPALAQPDPVQPGEDALQPVCTDADGALFRIDNPADREFDFTLRQAGGDASVSGSAYPVGRGGAFAFLPSGSSAELVVRGEVVSSADADGSACPTANVGSGRPICEGLRIDPDSRQALFVAGSEFRGVTEIEITVDNGRVLVYDPHALAVIDAGGAPAPVFKVDGDGRTTETFDPGDLFNVGYGLLLQGNATGAVAFFATITSPGGVVECDPQFAVAGEETDELAGDFALDVNTPNPFSGATDIAFTLDAASDVSLVVYDVLGRRVATLVDDELAAGPHTVTWDATGDDGRSVASGTYLYRLEAGGRTLSRSMTLVR